MYNQVECITITCDNCNQTFIEGHTGFSIFVDEEHAHSSADDSGWYSRDDIHYCPDCYELDEEDNLIIKIK